MYNAVYEAIIKSVFKKIAQVFMFQFYIGHLILKNSIISLELLVPSVIKFIEKYYFFKYKPKPLFLFVSKIKLQRIHKLFVTIFLT